MTDATKRPALHIDLGPHNSDWIKTRSWDLYDQSGELVTTPEQLLATLKRQGITLEHFLTLPAARAMPASLRQALDRADHSSPGDEGEVFRGPPMRLG